jgi:polysaccharide pyruvyl transferase WcaK-like protein
MKLIITGFYDHKNLGDDLFKEYAQQIFKTTDFERIKYVPIENITYSENKTYDIIILFGGEVLNDYFLDKLINCNKNNKNVKFYAFGVSTNQTYSNIINKLNIFEYIIFRNKTDYEYFKDHFKETCMYLPDIVFLTKSNTSKTKLIKKNKRIGFFLSQTSICNLNKINEQKYLLKIKNIIDYWFNKDYEMHFFPMCYSSNSNENDNIINKKIYNMFDQKVRSKFVFYLDNKNILDKIKSMKINICFRFHSMILSIIHNIPFVCISDTPKATNLMKEHDLLNLYNPSLNKINETFDYLLENKVQIKRNLYNIYNQNHKLAKQYYNYKEYLDTITKQYYYISNAEYIIIYNYITQLYTTHKTADDNDINTELILFNLIKTYNSDYYYGLSKCLSSSADNIRDNIYWLISDFIQKGNIYFYETFSQLLNKRLIYKNNDLNINITYMNQNDMNGLHRSGWQYVVNNLMKYNNINGTICDLYLDRTFHWNCEKNSKMGVIPYKKDWFGFIHHTTNKDYSMYNTTNLLLNKYFIQSLKCCKGLIVLSEYLKIQLIDLLKQNNLNVNVYSLTHPTEFISDDIKFTMNNFNDNQDKKIIQIGAWMRDIEAIFKLNINIFSSKKNNKVLQIRKAALKGKNMDSYYNDIDIDKNINVDESISRDKQIRQVNVNSSVEILTFHDDIDYDNLLKENIVFIKLIDASAVNTIIECVVRNTPILINKLDAVVEILGKEYPFYYDDLNDATNKLDLKLIEKTHHYLKKLDKTNLDINVFINKFKLIINSHELFNQLNPRISIV